MVQTCVSTPFFTGRLTVCFDPGAATTTPATTAPATTPPATTTPATGPGPAATPPATEPGAESPTTRPSAQTTAGARARQGAEGQRAQAHFQRQASGPGTYVRGPSLDDVTHSRGVLRQHHSGPGVRAAQERLNAAGQHVRVDGRFGPETEQAVRTFQRANGLREDGIIGPETAARLGGGATPARHPAPHRGTGASRPHTPARAPAPTPARPSSPAPSPSSPAPSPSGANGATGVRATEALPETRADRWRRQAAEMSMLSSQMTGQTRPDRASGAGLQARLDRQPWSEVLPLNPSREEELAWTDFLRSRDQLRQRAGAQGFRVPPG